jgi:hypothetical protein
MTLDKETATLVAAAIAATASLSNTVITAWRQSRLEERKWERARADELGRWERARTDELEKWARARTDELEKWKQQRQDDADAALRNAIASLGQQLATCVQTISWFTWKAEKAADSLGPEDIEKYDADMKALLPTLVSAHLLVVALDPTTDAAIKPLVETVYVLDARTALAAMKLDKSPKDALENLRQCYTDSEQFLNTLHDRFAGILTGAHAAITSPQITGNSRV